MSLQLWHHNKERHIHTHNPYTNIKPLTANKNMIQKGAQIIR